MCHVVEHVRIRGEFVNDDATRPAIRLVTDGEPASFEDFYRHEYRALLRLAWSLTGRRDLGEELVQEAMLVVHGQWGQVSGYDSPGGFARRVLLNAATSAARRRDAERRALGRLRRTDHHHEDATPPDEQFWAALRSLPERQCQTVVLHYLEDRSVAQIAAVLDVAENTVKVHLHRGRIALAELLGTGHEGTDR